MNNNIVDGLSDPAALAAKWWNDAKDENNSPETRAAALVNLARGRKPVEPDPAVADYVVAQLGVQDISEGWRNRLHLLTEQMQFTKPEARVWLEDYFLATAQVTMTKGERPPAHDNIKRHAAWAPIRRLASMIDAKKVKQLAGLLKDNDDKAELHHVIFNGIQTVFSVAPPDPDIDTAMLCDRIHELVQQEFIRDSFKKPSGAAKVLDACVALAALGEPRTSELIDTIITTSQTYGKQRPVILRKDLQALLKSWEQHTDQNHSALALLRQFVERIPAPPTRYPNPTDKRIEGR